jgi:hypothetical protein
MKTLGYLIVLAVLVIAGCAKDDTQFENQDNLELKKAKVPVPVKADCFATWDTESDLLPFYIPGQGVMYTYSRLNVSGTCSHVGKLNPETNFYVLESITFFMGDDGLPYTLNLGSGKLVAPNGDEIGFTFEVKQSFDENKSYTGKTFITPGTGTGKFKGCTGTFDEVGAIDYIKDGTWYKIDGYLVYE